MKRWNKRLLALVLCVVVLAGMTTAAFGDEIADLNDRYAQLQKEADDLQSKIDKAKTEKAKQ